MSEEILINITPPETRVALIENGVVQEVIIERTSSRGIVGNIYKGRVCRVLPGMQAAFVEIGLDRAAFLHASDIVHPNHEESDSSNITDLLREGEDIIVQVTKDPLGTKGARLTTGISIPSRYLVFMPSLHVVGISQKIDDEDERQRLREAIDAASRGEDGRPGRFIARTVAEGIDEDTLLLDMRFLTRLWKSIKERLETAKPREILHEDLPLAMRALRD
jgi:ribonuclease G